MTRLLIIRHGETIQNSKNICQGHMPGKLSENGITQCKELAKTVEIPDFIYASHLGRAIESAQHIFGEHYKGLTDERIAERFFGSLEGKEFPKPFDTFAKCEAYGAESIADITARMIDFTTDIKKRHPNKTVAIVSHGAAIRSLLAGLGEISLNESAVAKNCSVLELKL